MRVLGLLLLVCVVAACGDDFATVEPTNPERAADGLVFTRTDGSSYELLDAVATCTPSEQKAGVDVVRLLAPADVEDSHRPPFFMVEALPGVTGDYPLPLHERDDDAGPSDLTLFALDARRKNELSGSVEEATGKVTVREATCDPEPRLSLTIDARLASEIGLPPVRVRGGMATTGR
ncbi:hypothetical protein [Marmoricola sp. URHB0036]|uniref:hypothetical protein n=1 Tax=Marmoricola sp. URHB0036 TaxID=1298863 RepID=UPI000423B512|nr:hypothetical protein [Marmoricola sp. URHB0036]